MPHTKKIPTSISRPEDKQPSNRFSRIPHHVLMRFRELSFGAQALAACLAYFMNAKTNRCHVGEARLAELMGTSVRTVRRYFNEIKSKHVVFVERRGKKLTNQIYWGKSKLIPSKEAEPSPNITSDISSSDRTGYARVTGQSVQGDRTTCARLSDISDRSILTNKNKREDKRGGGKAQPPPSGLTTTTSFQDEFQIPRGIIPFAEKFAEFCENQYSYAYTLKSTDIPKLVSLEKTLTENIVEFSEYLEWFGKFMEVDANRKGLPNIGFLCSSEVVAESLMAMSEVIQERKDDLRREQEKKAVFQNVTRFAEQLVREYPETREEVLDNYSLFCDEISGYGPRLREMLERCYETRTPQIDGEGDVWVERLRDVARSCGRIP